VNFIDQLKLHRLKQFEEETARYESAVDLRLRILETVVEASRDGVVITDAASDCLRVQYVNPAFTAASQYSTAEIIGKPIASLWSLPANSEALASIQGAYQSAHADNLELQCKRKDGTAFWGELKFFPLKDENGSIHHWIHILRDIGDQKAYEETLVRARVAEEQNEKLLLELMGHKELERKLLQTAFYDSLTGLKNRAFFLEHLERSLQHTHTRSKYRCALLYLDLDGFKQVNDLHGHQIGDALLVEFSRTLKSCCRPQDFVCRMGGDEFTVLLDDIKTSEGAHSVAKRILDQLQTTFLVGGVSLEINVSIGICELNPRHKVADDVIREADMAMYRAKRGGGNQYASSDGPIQITDILPMGDSARKERDALSSAIEQGELELFYQPVVDINSFRVVQVETLVRWRHPERGLLKPSQFLPLAEKSGLIVPLGQLVIRAACLQLKEWQQLIQFRDTVLSINLSYIELADELFFENIIDLLADTLTEPGNLQFELAPDMLDLSRTGQFTERLRKIGIRIALSHPSEGNALLDVISHHAVDMLKLAYEPRRAKYQPMLPPEIIARTQGQFPSLAICIERVETIEHHLSLIRQGIRLAQGNLYSPPLPADEVIHTLLYGARPSAPKLPACG